MARKYRDYTNEEFISCAKQVNSIAGLLRKLGLRPAGGNYAHAKSLLKKLNVDTNHWTGQGWNKDKQLKDWTKYTKVVNLKKHLIRFRGHYCERCNLCEWQDNRIPLEIHHKDNDRTNNTLDNLMLLCCNCHALTDSWRKPRF